MDDKKQKKLRRLKQRTNPAIGNVYIFFAVLSIGGFLSFFMTKPTMSEMEKRELEKPPVFTLQNYFSGQFSTQADRFYADTFPFRDWFVNLGLILGESRGLRIDDIRIHETAPTQDPVSGEPTTPGSGEGESSEPAPTGVIDDGAQGEKNGSVFIYKGMGLSPFGGTQSMSKWYADTVNAYADALPGVQVYDLIIPTHIEFALPDRYKSITSSQKENMDYLYSCLNEKVKKVDAYSSIAQHAQKEYLYFNTDHHWTARGSYYAYAAFAEQAGFDPIPMEELTYNRLDSFLGTLYSETQDSKLREKGDFVEYPVITTPHTVTLYARGNPNNGVGTSLYAEYAKGVNSYSVFLAGDHPLMHIETELTNGRKIMVVKESFGNALIPYLVNHYEDVYVVDQRYFEKAAIPFIQENGINELLFANNIFAANTGMHIGAISDMMYKARPYQPPVTSSSEAQPPQEGETPEGDGSSSGSTPAPGEPSGSTSASPDGPAEPAEPTDGDVTQEGDVPLDEDAPPPDPLPDEGEDTE